MHANGLVAGVLAGLALSGPVGSCLAVDIDCRECHALEPRPAGAADFSAYYIERSRHHPVGVTLPEGGAYAPPQLAAEGIVFFDSNGNGVIDPDELRLSATGTIECTSCHLEHGDESSPVPASAAYVRRDNHDSALCSVCHRM